MHTAPRQLPPVVTAMLRADFYPARPAEVTLAQTHISYVLLAGDHVYKIKKPVRFTFLDFSTLVLRRHFCHEEVRLNRRLAGDTYVGVVAIRRDGDAYRLTAEDDPEAIEYAVQMHRLPADCMLDHLLDDGQVTTATIDAIATRLVEFHRHAASGPAITANGAPAAIWEILNDNFTGMRRFRDLTIPAADDDAIQAFSRGFLDRHDGLFRARQMQHRIRDCHGDLHSEHICSMGDRLVIFDCIEFNERFRYCDVASEIAFLAMDLEYHARPELAQQLIARYAALAGDPEVAHLVPFYQCYRAYVRGKVDSLKSAEEEVAAEERDAARASAFRHFALAYRYTWTGSPCLVVITGLSGTGKSALAAALHARTGFRHINSDVVRKRLAGVPLETRPGGTPDSGLYTAEMSARTYQTMYSEAAAELAAARGVILDGTFQRRVDRDAACALASGAGVPVLIVECQCNEHEVRRRLERRVQLRNSPSDADWTIYLQQRQRFEPFGPDEQDDHYVVDTAHPLSDAAAAIERELRKQAS